MKSKTTKDELQIEQKEGKELIQKTDVTNTPFTIISTEGKHFGALANYRLTNFHSSFEACRKDITKITWNRIIQVLHLTNQILNNQNK